MPIFLWQSAHIHPNSLIIRTLWPSRHQHRTLGLTDFTSLNLTQLCVRAVWTLFLISPFASVLAFISCSTPFQWSFLWLCPEDKICLFFKLFMSLVILSWKTFFFLIFKFQLMWAHKRFSIFLVQFYHFYFLLSAIFSFFLKSFWKHRQNMNGSRKYINDVLMNKVEW